MIKIYKIVSPNTDLVYVGKTELRLCDRMKVHKWTAKNTRNCSSKVIFDCGETSIELIEETDDVKRERFWISKLNSCNERKLDYPKNGRPEYKAEWYKENKEEILKKNSVPTECEVCGTFITKSNLRRHQKTQKCSKN